MEMSLSLHRDTDVERGGRDHLPGTFSESVEGKFWRRASLAVGSLWGI